MKMLQKAAAASTLAFFGLAFAAMAPSPARADTPSRPGGYCWCSATTKRNATLRLWTNAAKLLPGSRRMLCSPRREDSFAYAPRMHGQRR